MNRIVFATLAALSLLPAFPSDLRANENTTPAKAEALAAAARGVKQIVAHRGASSERPEGTLASTLRAIEVGATAVEVDVRTTADGKLVLLHDPTLDRTTTGRGDVGDLTFAEIRKLDAGSWFDPKYAAERVPTLSEVLTACRGKIDVLLDLKESGPA